MIGERSRLSLAQYLGLQGQEFLDVLFRKHGLRVEWEQATERVDNPQAALLDILPELAVDRILAVLEEVVATEGDLRERAVGAFGGGRGAYQARWGDLGRCLALDGYDIAGGSLRAAEPELGGAATSTEDAVTAEVRRSGLPRTDGIIDVINRSARDFLRMPPDYNGCLTNARVALESLARDIATERRRRKHPDPFDETKWGAVMSYLRRSSFVTEKEEQLACRLYDLLSEGAHGPVGLTDEEWVRLGRRMALSITYLLIKRHNGGA